MGIIRLITEWLQAFWSWLKPPSSGRNTVGLAMDVIGSIAEEGDDPESRAAGSREPHYGISPQVSYSQDKGLYVYHITDNQLGLGSSFGNAKAWAETKGTGHMQNLFSIDAGTGVMGGTSVSYLVPFSDLSGYGMPMAKHTIHRHDLYVRMMPTGVGSIHLHPAFQQHEFVLGDGLHILETFFLPRTGLDDPAGAYTIVTLANRTPHPLGITIVASLDPRGQTMRDIEARWDSARNALVAWNGSKPNWVRVFGGSAKPKGYLATTDEEEAYSPGHALENRIDGCGDPTLALQFDILLQPGQRHKLRLILAFSAQGQTEALKVYDRVKLHESALRDTIQHYTDALGTETIEMPDALLTQGVQWAKACLLRPLGRYVVGTAFTNDPGNSVNLVGRDTAWYVYGSDFVKPEAGCALLEVFAQNQRDDGLIAEYIDGNTGRCEFHDFNINDNTPLFVMAVAHHIKATGHRDCLKYLYEPALKAGELILRVRDENGLIKCTASGIGARGICCWRNVLQYEQITGNVTEVNSECYAALRALADLAEIQGDLTGSERFYCAAEELRDAINLHLINPENALYVRNIDLEGHVFTQATVDLVFPMICGIADDAVNENISSRLQASDFMTAGGIRALPDGNPHYHPSSQSGCLGGVWPGATWWYAMGTRHTQRPEVVAESLRRSYWHYIADPKTYNTVPGQFSEWSDGQTLVNRGMRLSPWEAPRFLWVAVEGIAGIQLARKGVALEPRLPDHWQWLRVSNLPYRGAHLSFFIARQRDGLNVYTCDRYESELIQHHYDEELTRGASTISAGISITAYRKGDEVLIALGNTLETPALGPFVAHHALGAGKRYHVRRLGSNESEWQDLGIIKGSDLQRITARMGPHGYTLYQFQKA